MTGVVIIGRNEGERLKRCVYSVIEENVHIVYVDSGSTDNSIEFVKSLGCDVVQLDTKTPFSAARARNEGFEHLVSSNSDISYIQFIDGDCELLENWLELGIQFLDKNNNYAIVAGHTKERFPDKSIYNRLCDIEWQTPTGDIKSCGGIFLIRANAFLEVGGFLPSVVAGEEPEFCYRLRQVGWKIFHYNKDMVWHDADILKFTQWWKRSVRSGLAYAQGLVLHGSEAEKYCVRETFRIWLWALLIPLVISILAIYWSQFFLLLIALYPMQLIRVALSEVGRLASMKYSFLYSFFVLLSKWPQLLGQANFFLKKLSHKQQEVIEYK